MVFLNQRAHRIQTSKHRAPIASIQKLPCFIHQILELCLQPSSSGCVAGSSDRNAQGDQNNQTLPWPISCCSQLFLLPNEFLHHVHLSASPCAFLAVKINFALLAAISDFLQKQIEHYKDNVSKKLN